MQRIMITTGLFIGFLLPTLVNAESNLENIREKYQLPSLGLTVITDQSIKSYITGVRKWNDPTYASIYDQYHLGSCTKAMTATLYAIYVQRGLVKWKTTMAEAFPEYVATMNPALKEMTVEQMTAHMSGISPDLSSYQNGKLWQKLRDPNLDPRTGRALVAKVALSYKPVALPGTKFIYSNTNYIIVGAYLEKMTHKSWEQLMQEDIFYPLNMSSCGFGPAGSDVTPPDQPWGHIRTETGPLPLKPDANADNPKSLGPAGTVHCSMQDWSKFLKIHIDGYNGKSSKILSARGFIKLHTPYPGQNYTYGGWGIEQRDWGGGIVLAHAGSNTYNLVNVWLAPKKNLGFLSVTNIGDEKAFSGTDEAIGQAIADNTLK